MIIVSGTVEIDAGDMERALVAVRAMVAETVKEDGCITYEFSRVIDRDTSFRIYEEWRDVAALQAHGKSAHMGVFRAALGELNVLSRDVFMVEAGEKTSL